VTVRADNVDLASACSWWQNSRDGSSLLRAAARCLTGQPHYFAADFISDYERRASSDLRALEAARLLLDAVRSSPLRTTTDWCRLAGLPDTDFAGRGLQSKPEDEQIRARLANGTIVIPLWGVSLSRDIARSYGTRWLFLISGAFSGVAAGMHSGVAPEQQEVITGGRYAVLGTEKDAGTTIVRLQVMHAVSLSPLADSPGRASLAPQPAGGGHCPKQGYD
jgi:hypothetical protein